jgi:hypothetical protein
MTCPRSKAAVCAVPGRAYAFAIAVSGIGCGLGFVVGRVGDERRDDEDQALLAHDRTTLLVR